MQRCPGPFDLCSRISEVFRNRRGDRSSLSTSEGALGQEQSSPIQTPVEISLAGNRRWRNSPPPPEEFCSRIIEEIGTGIPVNCRHLVSDVMASPLFNAGFHPKGSSRSGKSGGLGGGDVDDWNRRVTGKRVRVACCYLVKLGGIHVLKLGSVLSYRHGKGTAHVWLARTFFGRLPAF